MTYKKFEDMTDSEIAQSVRDLKAALEVWKRTNSRMTDILDGTVTLESLSEYQKVKAEHEAAWDTYYDLRQRLGVD